MDINKIKEKCEEYINKYTSYPEDPLYGAIMDVCEEYDDYKDINNNHEIKEVLSEETGDRRRWSYGMQSVWKIDDNYLSFWWDAPATEGQEGQPTNMQVGIVERKTEMVEKVYYE